MIILTSRNRSVPLAPRLIAVERCPPRQKSRVERINAKVGPDLTQVTVESHPTPPPPLADSTPPPPPATTLVLEGLEGSVQGGPPRRDSEIGQKLTPAVFISAQDITCPALFVHELVL